MALTIYVLLTARRRPGDAEATERATTSSGGLLWVVGLALPVAVLAVALAFASLWWFSPRLVSTLVFLAAGGLYHLMQRRA